MMDNPFTAVMIIPTGIGATIGGHAGDGTWSARLLAQACDRLIVHPNVVNAADYNEIPANALYVEGSMLDRFLRGEIDLQPARSNHILLACNRAAAETLNCASTAHLLLGASVEVVELETPLTMISRVADNRAGGEIDGLDAMCRQCARYDFDALAIHTEIQVDREAANHYVRTLEGINPWGGVEAIVSRRASEVLGVPVAHAPVETNQEFNEPVPESIAPELVSVSMLYSVLKGLHRAPRIAREHERDAIDVDSVDVMISPDCWGAPHEACARNGIPIIRVTGNKTTQPAPRDGVRFLDAATYREAAGWMLALRSGLTYPEAP